MSDYSLVNFIFDKMASEGFRYVGFSGRIGEEVLSFKNEAGEVRTVKHGFTPAKPKNLKFKIKGKLFPLSQLKESEVPTLRWKGVNFSLLRKKGGENG